MCVYVYYTEKKDLENITIETKYNGKQVNLNFEVPIRFNVTKPFHRLETNEKIQALLSAIINRLKE